MELSMIKVFVVVGTRPEAIKMAPIIVALRAKREYQVRVCATSQHKEMLQQVFDFFRIKSDFDLQVMEPNQSLSSLTAKILLQLTDILVLEKPDWIVVQGDTTTAMAATLAGFYQKIKIAHVEAGLRSREMYSPFPEEMNRSVISKMATCHFCPTDGAVINLQQEGISKNVFNVGNSVVDSVLRGIKIVKESNEEYRNVFNNIDFDKKIILVTCHRRESFGEPFINICKALLEIVELLPDFIIVYPVHLNPNIKSTAQRYLIHPRIYLTDPLSYPHLLWFIDKSELVLTDSGGIQEEAPSLHKPVLVLRDVTERMEGINAGTAILVGTDTDTIVKNTVQIVKDKEIYKKMAFSNNPYGDGKTSERIATFLKEL
jgi:UDP-N-acetylglucosamine 2-epimerase (non-hydrolysing)